MADDVEDGVVYAAAMSDDDEVVDAVANTGDSCHSLDAPISDNGVLHVKAMAEEDDEEEDKSSALASNEPPLNVQDAPNDDWPLLERWRWTPDGAVCGYVHGKEGFRDGELMTTSVVNPEGRFPTYIITDSGSAYRLGEQASGSGGMRRSSRAAVGKDSLLDAFADSIHTIPGAPGLRYAVGGADVGGITAEKIMRSSFSVLDDNLVNLRAQYQTARRVVLLNGDSPVAASVVEVHAEQSVLEVPILAAARAQRIQGYGSILVATLKELGSRLRLRILVVSATQESMRFWLRQGLHAPAHCPTTALRAALRKMDQSARRGFANSITMAMELPTSHGGGMNHSAGHMEVAASSNTVARVLRRLKRRTLQDQRALTPLEAPAELGYVDVNSVGNFFLDADGKRRCAHRPQVIPP